MTALDLFTYDGHDIRVMNDDGSLWFVAADVAKVLGYRMASDLTRTLDDDERGTRPVRTPSGVQDLAVVSEPGLYKAIVQRQTGRMTDGSAKDYIKEFQRRLTHEILPTIRKTGSYSTTPAPVVDVSTLDRRALALMVIEAEDARAEAEAARDIAEQRAAELEPSALAWDHLATAEGDYQVADAAKILTRAGIKTGRDRLFAAMGRLGWVYRGRGDNRWRTYQAAIERGWLSELPTSHYHPRTGELVLDPPQVRVTVKGLAELRERLARPGTTLTTT